MENYTGSSGNISPEKYSMSGAKEKDIKELREECMSWKK